jgi:hypothetical protein
LGYWLWVGWYKKRGGVGGLVVSARGGRQRWFGFSAKSTKEKEKEIKQKQNKNKT